MGRNSAAAVGQQQAAPLSCCRLHHVGQTASQVNLDGDATIKKSSIVQAREQLSAKGSPKHQQ